MLLFVSTVMQLADTTTFRSCMRWHGTLTSTNVLSKYSKSAKTICIWFCLKLLSNRDHVGVKEFREIN